MAQRDGRLRSFLKSAGMTFLEIEPLLTMFREQEMTLDVGRIVHFFSRIQQQKKRPLLFPHQEVMLCTTRDFVSIGMPPQQIQQIFAWKTEMKFVEISSLLQQTRIKMAKMNETSFNDQALSERMNAAALE
jgi:hypothetical protein